MNMTNKILIALVLLTTVLVVVLYALLLWPVTIITPNRQPYSVPTKVVKHGDPVVYIVDACKTRSASAIVTKIFVSEEGIQYPSLTNINNISEGCSKSSVRTPVPTYLMPGKYHILLNIEYKLNYVRSVSYSFTTEDFEVK